MPDTNTQSEIITAFEQRVSDDLTAVDREARFDAMLDECYSFEKVGGIFANMQPSRVLKEVDPIAYRCGVNDYEDSEEWVEIGGSYYDKSEVEKIKEEMTDELDSEESDLQDKIDDEDTDEADLPALNIDLENVRAKLATLDKHSY